MTRSNQPRSPLSVVRLVAAASVLALFAAAAWPARAQAPPTVIVVDASGSMSAAMDGSTRLDVARNVLGKSLVEWPAAAPLGLVAYGHRRTGDCSDIEVLSPIGPPDVAGLRKRLDALLARGKTPLAASLQQAAGLLKAFGRGGTIILVTDGIETCHPDPCAVVAALRAADAALSVHVIGFAVDTKDKQQLACIASAGGGQYRTAADASSLLASLDTAARAATVPTLAPSAPVLSAPAPPEPSPPEAAATPEPVKMVQMSFVPVVEQEGPLSDHSVAWRIVGRSESDPFLYEGSSTLLELGVPAGRYTIEAAASNVSAGLDVALSGEAARVEVLLPAGRLRARVVPHRGAPPIEERDGLVWTLVPLDGQATVEVPRIAQPQLLLATGRYRIAVEHQGRRADAEVTIAGGKPADLELSLRLGELHLSAALADKAEPLTEWRGLSWRVLALDGKTLAEAVQQAAPLFLLPAGKYRVELVAVGVTIAREIEVSEGERRQERLLLPTGKRVLTAALAPRLQPLTDWRDTTWTVTAMDVIGMAPGTALMADQPIANPTVDLSPGRWQVAVRSGPVTAEREVLVAPESDETVRIDLQAARLEITAAPEEGAPLPANIVFEIFPVAADGSLGPAVATTGSSHSAGSLLPAGRWRISAIDDHGRRAEASVDIGGGEEKVLALTLR